MEKRVILLILPKRKCIKYRLKENVSELQTIREALLALCEKDAVLKMMIKEKLIVFQRSDPDYDGEWLDIEEDDIIEDKSQIKVVLIPMLSDITADISNRENFSTENMRDDDVIEMNVDVLYTEPERMKTNENIQEAKKGASFVYEANENVTKEEKSNLEVSIIPGGSGLQAKSSRQLKQRTLIKGCIPYPASLPPITFDLEKLLKERGIEKSQQHFIKFWGQFLWQETYGKPTRQDYDNVASAIITAYPELAGGSNKNGIVRSQLSVWIRNHRKATKPKVKTSDSEQFHKKQTKLSTITKASIVDDEKHLVNDTDIEMAVAELNKKFIPGKNTSHIKLLLQTMKSVRRPWIENQAGRIIDIVDRYPQLQDYEMILFEGINVTLNLTEEEVFKQINSLIDDLQKYYSVEGHDVEDNSNEKMKAFTLAKLCEDLTVKHFKNKKVPQLCIVLQVLGSTQPLLTNEGDAPRLVLYTNEDSIQQAFIVADKEISVSIPDPTTCKVIGGVLSAYYAWHRSFPTAYMGILEFITHKVFNTPLKNNSTVAKFKRKVENCLQKL